MLLESLSDMNSRAHKFRNRNELFPVTILIISEHAIVDERRQQTNNKQRQRQHMLRDVFRWKDAKLHLWPASTCVAVLPKSLFVWLFACLPFSDSIISRTELVRTSLINILLIRFDSDNTQGKWLALSFTICPPKSHSFYPAPEKDSHKQCSESESSIKQLNCLIIRASYGHSNIPPPATEFRHFFCILICFVNLLHVEWKSAPLALDEKNERPNKRKQMTTTTTIKNR